MISFHFLYRKCVLCYTCTGDDDVMTCCAGESEMGESLLSSASPTDTMRMHFGFQNNENSSFKVIDPLYCIVYYSNQRSKSPVDQWEGAIAIDIERDKRG